eukprot:4386066-Amphidinium_carterae.1
MKVGALAARCGTKDARGLRQQRAALLAGRHPLSDRRHKSVKLDWIREVTDEEMQDCIDRNGEVDTQRVLKQHWLL